MNSFMGTGIIGLIAFLGGGYALFKAMQGFFIGRDILQGNRKISLLQTIIDAKNIDIVKDQQKAKEASDVYEASKSKYDPNSDR